MPKRRKPQKQTVSMQIRMPVKLHAALRREASLANCSLNSQMVEMLTAHLRHGDMKSAIINAVNSATGTAFHEALQTFKTMTDSIYKAALREAKAQRLSELPERFRESSN